MVKALFSSNSEEWYTPKPLFNALNKTYGFTLDPCCTKESALCSRFFTKKEDGLHQSWEGERVFLNPPYGREIRKWIEKAARESEENSVLVVALLPARTDTKWFHDYIYKKHQIIFLKGRIKFSGASNSAPFPSMIVIFSGIKTNAQKH